MLSARTARQLHNVNAWYTATHHQHCAISSVSVCLIALSLRVLLLLLQLFESLRSNSSITSVNLSSNHFGDEGVQVSSPVTAHAAQRSAPARGGDAPAAPSLQRLVVLHLLSVILHTADCRQAGATPCCVMLLRHAAGQALVDVLQQGGCSELISLDLRGNSLSAQAEALLVSPCGVQASDSWSLADALQTPHVSLWHLG